MAPSPAAGKQQQPSGTPSTPTKLQRKPQQTPSKPSTQTPKKLGQSATKTPSSAKSQSGNVAGKAQQSAQGAKGKAEDTTQGAKGQAEGAKDQAQGAAEGAKDQAQGTVEGAKDQAEGQSKEESDDEGPMSKVTQAGQQGKQGLEEQAPQPVDDAEDTVEGAKNEAEDTAEGATDEADDAATEKAGGESADDMTDDQDGQQQQEGGLLSGAKGLAGKASGLAGKASQDPKQAAQDAPGDIKQGAEETAENAEEGAEEGADEAQKVAGETTDEAGDTAESAADTAEGAVDGAKDTAEGAADEAGDAAEGAVDQTGETAEGAADEAQEGAEDAADEAGEAAEGVEKPDLPLDLSILKGLEVQEDGGVVDQEGNPVGKLAEGDAEDLAGYPIGDDGEILDDDGDLVGRVELLPDQVKKQMQEAKAQGVELPEGADEYLDQLDGIDEEGEGEGEDDEDDGPQLPGLEILNGLTCQVDGLIYDDEGNTIGKVTDGEAAELQNATLNDQGEFIDEDGNVVGHADIHEDAADLVTQGVYDAAGTVGDEADEVEEGAEDAAEGAEDAVDGVADQAEEAGEEAAEGAEDAAEGIEDELPGIEALQGKELNEAGEIVDAEGNVLANIEDEDLKAKIESGEIDANDLEINEEGQVVDKEGNVLGGDIELVDGAAEKLAKLAPQYDLRILEGRKVNKKGKVLDDDGEEIGQLKDGEAAKCAGKKINDKGEVIDKEGNVIGSVGITDGEAAEEATKALLEELEELEPQEQVPDVAILEGYKVNKKGQILDEDGEPIGELADGELSDCAGKKVNDKGEILDKNGEVVGHVRALPQNPEDIPEEFQQEQAEEEGEGEEGEQEEGEAEEEGPELPPLSVLDGLSCNKAGKLLDANGTIVGELVEGDAKKLSKSGLTSDDQGQFWDNKGHVIGRAQTVPVEEADEEPPFAGLDGLVVVQGGYVQDENGNTVGVVTEGDAKKLVGRAVDEDGDIIDKRGSVVGHADRYEEEEPEEEQEEEPEDLSSLQGKQVNKSGMVIGDNGVPVARLVEGNAKQLAGKTLDDQGQIWNDQGQVIGRVQMIPQDERDETEEGPFAGLEGLKVIEGGKVADENGNVVGEITEGNPKRLIGLSVDEDGDIIDKHGSVKGHADPLPDEEEPEEVDNSELAGRPLNKQGFVNDDNGLPIGRLVEGDAKDLVGRKCDENGYLYNDTGKVAGRCEVIPENERPEKPEGVFAGYEDLRVNKEGWVVDGGENVVGQLVEGNAKKLAGMAVDEDGDIYDKYGNVKGHAEPYEEEEQGEVDLSALAGTTINKAGKAVDNSGAIIGQVVEGDVSTLIGKKVDGEGQVWDNAGNVVGRCELAFGQGEPEGPFAGFDECQIQKDGTVTTPAGDIIGRVIEGDIQKLLGHTVDEDGDINDKNGNTIGKAERWSPEEKERRVNPMSGARVNKEGEVRDENGDLIGRLTDGNLGHCVGMEIDDNGNVVDQDGNKIGEATLLENIDEEEYTGPTEEELAEAAKREEERDIAEKMNGICTQTLERMQPICKQITEHIERADRTPKEELDEEELVNQVKPLIEEGGRILQECNGTLRGLDPDGHIAAQAKGRSGTNEATPEEYRLAENLKELTTTVVTTIDNAKKKLNDMPHAKKKLNPLWGLMTQPLFQIIAAVGLLLAGVLGLVGQLLNGLGLGGLVNGLLGGLGVDKLFGALGLGGGDKKKGGKSGGGGGLSSLPVIGGMLGGK